MSEKDSKVERFYFPELVGLRFLAFLLVFFHHHPLLAKLPYVWIINQYGWIGVDLFFVLSAYLFTRLLIAECNKKGSISFPKFYIRRIFRIWPIYFLIIGIQLLLLNQPINHYEGIRIIGMLTFCDNIMTAIMGYNPLPFLGHLWSITYEEQFYIFIPIVILLLFRSSHKIRLITFFIIFLLFSFIRLVYIARNVPHPAIWTLPVTHFESILLGIVIGFGGFNFLIKKINPLIIGFFGVFFFLLLYRLPNIYVNSYKLIFS
jgi:peptidoglycan/LPS O-acetylase OafA/YrhL